MRIFGSNVAQDFMSRERFQTYRKGANRWKFTYAACRKMQRLSLNKCTKLTVQYDDNDGEFDNKIRATST